MKKVKKLLAAFLAAATFGTSFSNANISALALQTTETAEINVEDMTNLEDTANLEDMMNPEEYDSLELDKELKEESQESGRLEESYEETSSTEAVSEEEAVSAQAVSEEETSKAEADSEQADNNLPSSADLSTDSYYGKFFPEVENQGSNPNCSFYSFYYTNTTFQNNLARGIQTTKNTSVNPMFGYNYAEATGVGSFDLAEQIGYPLIGALPLDTSNHKSLYPSKEVWESALNNRPAKMELFKVFGNEDSIITNPKDATLNTLKKTLSSGVIVACGTVPGKWNMAVVASEKYKGQEAIDRCDQEDGYGHIVSIVGYDDDIWIDINHNGKVESAEKGAFKIVNSWGKGWANGGFCWLAYDALNRKSQVLTASDEQRINQAIDAGSIQAKKVNSSARNYFFMDDNCTRIRVREKANSGCLCYMTVNTRARREMTMSVTATNRKSGATKSYQFPKAVKDTEDLAWDGTNNATDATMVFDLENVVSDISSATMGDYSWKVTFTDDTLNSNVLIVKDLYFTVDGTKVYTTDLNTNQLNGSNRVYEMVPEPKLLSLTPSIESGRIAAGQDVTFTATSNLYDNVKYEYKMCFDNQTSTVRAYSTSPSYKWTSKFSYYPTSITVTAKSTITGKTASKTIEYKVNKALKWGGSSVASSVNVGEKLNVAFSVEGGVGAYTYTLAYKYDNEQNKTVVYSGNSSKNVTWTPAKSGKCTVYLSVQDEVGNSVSKEYSVTVIGRNNTATIYYYNSNYQVANIHYQVENGSWTPVPGVQMSKSSEQSGYTWKYVINLGEATKATVCFNNGNNSWDNNNNANYSIPSGIYGVKNGKLTKLNAGTNTPTPTQKPTATPTQKPTATPTQKPTATPTQKPTPTVAPGKTATIYYANSNWNNANVHYSVNGSWTSVPGMQMSKSDKSGYTWKYVINLQTAQTATLCFNNGSGSWDSKNGQNYTVSSGAWGIKDGSITMLDAGLSVTLTADRAVGGTHSSIAFTANAENGTAPYSYQYTFARKTGSNPYTEVIPYTTTARYSYVTYYAGTYDITVTVKDATGKTANYTIENYKIEGPKFESFTVSENSPQKPGTTLTLNAKFVNIQSDPYNTYSFYAIKDGVTTYIDSSRDGVGVWTPKEEGDYTLKAVFTTYMGVTYETTMQYTIKDTNKLTVYYSTSWTDTYMHYGINGQWTSVPGVKMTKTTEKSGYNYKLVIDLGTATHAQVCFNNGSGSWDSKNGSNYLLGSGTYGIKDGTIYNLK